MEQFCSHLMEFHEIWYEDFSKKLSSKFNFHYNIKITTGTVHANQFIVLLISQSVFLRMKNASDISRREN